MKKLTKIMMAGIYICLSAGIFASSSKKSIVCTTFPEYDWIMNILGNKHSEFNVTLLQNKGADLHSYQPTIKDMTKISLSDLFVYVGGESDAWVEKALANSTNKNQIAVNMMEVLGDRVKEEEIVEGMQESEEEEHHHDEEEEIEYDEHIWLSLKNASIIMEELCKEIENLDEKNAEIYKANTKAYLKQLADLDAEFAKTVASSKYKTLLFADRFPFRYFTEDYNLKYYAAFVGCSAESEAKFETIAFLSKKVDELGLKSILTIEKSNKKIATSIISNSKTKDISILEMDSLQSITVNDIKKGKTYLSTMKANLEIIKTVLN